MCAIMGFSKKTYTKEELLPFFDRTRSRGPDMSQIVETPSGWLCFHRLAIMGLTEAGMQPFELDGDYVVCNGEIYGFRPLKRQLTEKGYSFRSGSDCEILLPLYREYGLEMFAKLDAEFALIIYDSKRDELIAARDPIGIRPLYYGYDRCRRHRLCQRSRKTWWGCVRRSAPSRRDTITRTENLSAMRISPPSRQYSPDDSGDRLPQHPQQADRRRWINGWTRTLPWASCSPAGWTPPWCAPSAP